MNGIITIAVRGEHYVRYAENLAISARLRGVPVSIVVGKSVSQNIQRHLFDKVFEIQDPIDIESCWELKLYLNQYDTGYSNTIFVDVDALIVRGLGNVFAQIEKYGFLMPSERIIRKGDRWDNKDVYQVYKEVYKEDTEQLPQINGGFFGWRKGSIEAEQWFITAKQTMEIMKPLSYKREELAMLLVCGKLKAIIHDPHIVAQMWCCAREHSMSFIGDGYLISKMPWWDRPYNAYIAHFGSGYMIDRSYYWTAIRGLMRRDVYQPSISVLIPTFARVEHLEEAIASVLSQQYDNFEIVVCNDCARQTLYCTDKRVRVLNKKEQFNTLGEKRNFLIDNADGDIFTFLDDDDIILPWHLKQLADVFYDYKCDSVRMNRALAFTRIDKIIKWGAAPICVAVRWEKSPRFNAKQTGEDQDFRGILPNAIDYVPDNPAYVYEWGNGVHHMSALPSGMERQSFNAEAFGRMDKKKEPEGEILLVPKLKPDVADWFITGA